MQMRSTRQSKEEGTFLYLLLLTGFFFLLEISFFIQCNRMYLSDYTFMTNHLDLPLSIIPGIAFYLFAQLLVHFGYCVVIWLMSSAIAHLFKLSYKHHLIVSMIIWTCGIITALAANQYLYPNSKFTELSLLFLPDAIEKIVFPIASLLMAICLILAIKGSKIVKWLSILLTIFICASYLANHINITSNPATSSKPNIILVGVDSLRPDYLSYFGGEQSTPFFDTFLEQATSFSDAVTPLARTFPSWVSILSGSYPRELNVRTNLVTVNQSQLSTLLPSLLRKEGYDTLFATDETRFNNIDHTYGFDHTVTPPMGLNDFILGSFNDFPLSNLLLNTSVGEWLFPHSYANRPVFFSYNPNTFLQLIHPYLQEKRSRPLFLAIHFCLPHYPYLWSGLSGRNYEPLARYQQSILRVDQQLSDFFSELKQAHLLDHAIVVLLSDHGEALELRGDRITEADLFQDVSKRNPVPVFYPQSLDKASINQSVGHGTDVLGLTQYHTLLAFKLYGMGEQRKGIVPGVVSLTDIKQTVLDLINYPTASLNPSSISLAPIINGNVAQYRHHEHLFIESDFSPEAIRTVYPEARKVVLEGIELFQINPKTTRLTVKDEMVQKIIKSKQYADISGEWMLAIYPQSNHTRMPILINLVNGKWTNDLQSSFAKQSPAANMLAALQAFYGNELN